MCLGYHIEVDCIRREYIQVAFNLLMNHSVINIENLSMSDNCLNFPIFELPSFCSALIVAGSQGKNFE